MAADCDSDALARIVLYDGVCGFCNRSVRWLLARDTNARLRFASFQGKTAERLRASHPEIPVELESMIYVETSEGQTRIHRDSEAIFRVLAQLARPWSLLAWCRVLPRGLTDFAYRQVVNHRYSFGRSQECPLPSGEERARFLD